MTKKARSWTDLALPGYTVLKKIGRTGNCVLLKARQEALERDVLIKLVGRNDKDAIKAVQREVQLKVDLNHEAVASPIDEGETGSYHFFVIELPAGTPFTGIGRKKPHEMQKIIEGLFQLLVDVHSRGVVIGPVAPSDLRITPEGDVRLLHLENASRPGKVLSTIKLARGSEPFLSPELLKGRKTNGVKSDLYHFGAVCFYALNGSHPYGEGSPKEILKRIQDGNRAPFVRRGKLSRSLEQMICRLLSPAEGGRPRSAREVLAEVQQTSAHTTIIPQVKRSRNVGMKTIVAVACLALAAGLITFLVVLSQQSREGPEDPGASGRPWSLPDDDGKASGSGGATKPVLNLNDEDDKAYQEVLRKNRAAPDDWQADIDRLDAFLSAYPKTNWFEEAANQKLHIRKTAEEKAKLAFQALERTPSITRSKRLSLYEAFVKRGDFQGTRAAAKAQGAIRKIITDSRNHAAGAVEKAGAFLQSARFEAAVSVLSAAKKLALDADKQMLDTKIAEVGEKEKAWLREGAQWRGQEKAIRALAAERGFDRAVELLADETAAFSRDDLVRKRRDLKQACILAAEAFERLLEGARAAQQSKETFLFDHAAGNETEGVRGRFVSVSKSGCKIKQYERNTYFTVDLLKLRWDTLLALIAPRWKHETPIPEAVFYLLVLSGELKKAEKLKEAAFGSVKLRGLKEKIDAFLSREKNYAAGNELETEIGRISTFLADGYLEKADAALAALIGFYAKTASFREQEQRLFSLFKTVYLKKRKKEGAGGLFHASKVSLQGKNRITLEYRFLRAEETFDWKPQTAESFVRYVEKKGMEVVGTVVLKGRERIFGDWLRVDGMVMPLRVDPPNCNIILWGADGSYSVLFGLGFEENSLDLTFPEKGKLFGPTNVVFAQKAEGDPWTVLFHDFSRDTKLPASKLSSFRFADLRGDLQMDLDKKRVCSVPVEKVHSTFPAAKKIQPRGSVLLATFESPVRFRSLTIQGSLEEDWLETVWHDSAKEQFRALCEKSGK